MRNKDKKPQISILMGVYNIANLPMLSHAMDSILKQTFLDFEWIICNDGSNDASREILDDYAKRDARIVLIENEHNQGLAYSLNRSLEKARGTLIVRQDADDISALDRLEKQVLFLNRHPEFAFVGSNVILWNETGNWRERIFPPSPNKEDFLFTMPFVHGTLMFRRSALELVGGYRIAKETKRTEDYDMLMRMYAKGLRGANLQEPLYRFREDQAAFQRRKYRYRIDEARVRYGGFSALGLMPKGILYVIKPLVVGLIPTGILVKLKKFRGY